MSGFILTDFDGITLHQQDQELLQHPGIAGVILFSRNYHDPEQLKLLTGEIKKIRESLLVFVDHEGGRVQRFQEGFTRLPSMSYWGKRYQEDPAATKQALQAMTTTMVNELRQVGVPVSLAPVLDVDHGVSAVIGERSFSADPRLVVALAQMTIDSMHAAGMPAIGKHFPGHGGVAADSHTVLPVDPRTRETILACDLQPFAQLAQQLDAVMPAHVVYTAFSDQPATFSPYWLQQVLREELHFEGLVISDDLTMAGAAIVGDYPVRAQKALQAGCDLLSICNNRSGVQRVLEAMGDYHHSSSQQRLKVFTRKIL